MGNDQAYYDRAFARIVNAEYKRDEVDDIVVRAMAFPENAE